MPTLTAALVALERHCGFPQSRTRGISRQLQDAGLLPLGTPGTSPAIAVTDFLSLFVAVAADPGAKRLAPEVARTYLALTPGGLPVAADTPPTLVPAATILDALAHLALADRSDLKPLHLEFVATWPEIALLWRDGRVERYQATGTLPGHWQSNKHRTSTTVAGTAFADAVRAVFL